jgi:hypothetical protein
MLDQIAADPTFLQHIVWGDESRVYVGKDLNGKIKVWHYRGQTEGASPADEGDHNNNKQLVCTPLLQPKSLTKTTPAIGLAACHRHALQEKGWWTHKPRCHKTSKVEGLPLRARM